MKYKKHHSIVYIELLSQVTIFFIIMFESESGKIQIRISDLKTYIEIKVSLYCVIYLILIASIVINRCDILLIKFYG